MSSRPSKKQKELLSFIEGFIAGHGYGPSYREIMRSLNYKSVSTVAIHVDNLIKKGLLNKKDRSARSLEIVSGASKTNTSSPVQKNSAAWLEKEVNGRFAEYGVHPSKKKLDELYVLVGTLHILGLEQPYRKFRTRLSKLAK